MLPANYEQRKDTVLNRGKALGLLSYLKNAQLLFDEKLVKEFGRGVQYVFPTLTLAEFWFYEFFPNDGFTIDEDAWK